ncbi:MAG: methyltransferase domain-containing protein [Nitrosopumilus sp.]|nr:methyltransferase domain-containing protein [Nitrosopumilus sp.]
MKISLSSYNHLSCINHKEKKNYLVLDNYIADPLNNNDCKEGMLTCNECYQKYPIIDGIAIIVSNFVIYCSERMTTFGKWLLDIESDELKDYLKNIAKDIGKKNINENNYETDGLYYQSYKWLHNENFESDKFLHLLRWKIKPSDIYRKLASNVIYNPEGMGLDLGCALGLSTFEIAKKFSFVIGVDTSFSFIKEARKKAKEQRITNIEFIVTDILNLPFKNQKFDLIFGLNIIEFVSITKILDEVHNLLKPHCIFIITSPYDYNRENAYDQKMDDIMIRKIIEKNGFEISHRTKNESFIPWMLKINERTYLFYFLDFVEAKKISKHKY